MTETLTLTIADVLIIGGVLSLAVGCLAVYIGASLRLSPPRLPNTKERREIYIRHSRSSHDWS